MVLEISTDGTNWTDIGASATPTYGGTIATGGGNVIQGRKAYVGNSAPYPSFIPVTVDLGSTYAGQDVRIRFRVATDLGGFAPGVEIRNFATSGLANTPFPSVVADSGVCPTNTALASSLNPSRFGDQVTFTASVSGGVTTATGTVNFLEGTTVLGSGTLDQNSQATFATSSLTTGTHSVTASYSGDSTNAPSVSAAVDQVVQQSSTTINLSSNLNPSSYGQAVTFTAAISSGGATPTGTVTFYDGTDAIGTGTISSGSATFTTSSLGAGTHSISASYAGDSNIGAGTSNPVSQVVNPASTTTTGSSTPNPSFVLQPVTISAKVTSATGPIPSGTVTFRRGTTTIGTATLDGTGAASITVSNLPIGNSSISAVYSGSTNFSGSTSSTITQVVKINPSSTTLASSQNPASHKDSVTITATVSGNPWAPVSGFVVFRDGSDIVSIQSLSGGKASFTDIFKKKGTHNLTATYSGSSTYSSSTSPVLVEVIN